MKNFIYFYQHIPSFFSPIAFEIGFFSIGWYSLMYGTAFLTVYLLLAYRIKKGEDALLNNKIIFDFLLIAFLGLLIGARMGYVFFYDFSFFWENPLAVISPLDPVSGKLVGIYGMSYHGGLIGVAIATLIFLKKYRKTFWNFSDFIIPAIPAGYFFGRIGNFLNGELYGRITDKFWGMYFPLGGGPTLRHPSQLYEALLEGLLLFVIFWSQRNNPKLKGKFLALYLIGYALARIICEFFRQPDEQIGFIGNYFTLGQALSLFMAVFGLGIIYWRKAKRMV